MKESKTVTIQQLITELNGEKKAQEFETTVNKCLNVIVCENIDWKNFQVYKQSADFIRYMIKGIIPEYIMAICDQINIEQDKERTVKIIILSGKTTEISTVNYNRNTKLVCVYLSHADQKYILKKSSYDDK